MFNTKLSLRLQTIFFLLFNIKKNWMFISLDKENLFKHLAQESFEVNVISHGLQEYNTARIIHEIAKNWDEDDLILMRSLFEAKATMDK